MNVDLVTVFLIYLSVFLAVVVGAWILFSWRRRRSGAGARHLFICATCGGRIKTELPRIWVRCPKCGARHELTLLKEISVYGNVDRS
jgi:DNA-directed RNA polymerase subunit RPC12/RpoP